MYHLNYDTIKNQEEIVIRDKQLTIIKLIHKI